MAGAAHQFHFVPKFGYQGTEQLIQPRIVQPLDHLTVELLAAVGGGHDDDAIVIEIVYTLEIFPHANGPCQRRTPDIEDLLNLIEQLNRFATFTIEFVDKGNDWRIPQSAHLHQLDGPLLDALGRIDHHQCRVHRGEGAIGILGEVLVTGSVQQVDDTVAIGELHHRGGNGDAALLLKLHPVGGGMPCRLATLDGTGKLDRTAKQQQLFREGGLTRIGVRDDGKGAALADLLGNRTHEELSCRKQRILQHSGSVKKGHSVERASSSLD